MRIVLETCKKHKLFFLDSRTNYRSVVSKLGKEIGIPVLENQLFLDDINEKRAIRNQVRKLAEKEDAPYAIAIGHVGDSGRNTTAILSEAPSIVGTHWRFVTLSTLVRGSAVPGPAPQAQP